MMIAMSIALSIIESVVSAFFFAFPGIKLGLANIATLVVIFTMGRKEGATVALLRIFLVGLIYSGLGGGICALMIMLALKNSKLSIFTISVLASLSHMVGQIAIAILVVKTTTLLYYLPYMMIISVPTGLVTGYLAKRIITDFSQKIMNY